MLDVFMRRERHIYLKPMDGYLDPRFRPSLRDFGPKSEDDLLDQRNIQTLEKLLPVLNGLIYLKQENRTAILKDYDLLMTLFDIFHCKLPIELHENALYALLNLFSDCSNKVKEFIMTLPMRKDLQKQGSQR